MRVLLPLLHSLAAHHALPIFFTTHHVVPCGLTLPRVLIYITPSSTAGSLHMVNTRMTSVFYRLCYLSIPGSCLHTCSVIEPGLVIWPTVCSSLFIYPSLNASPHVRAAGNIVSGLVDRSSHPCLMKALSASQKLGFGLLRCFCTLLDVFLEDNTYTYDFAGTCWS
jgi:hypothetical protein